jgi:hypothetical protein
MGVRVMVRWKLLLVLGDSRRVGMMGWQCGAMRFRLVPR